MNLKKTKRKFERAMETIRQENWRKFIRRGKWIIKQFKKQIQLKIWETKKFEKKIEENTIREIWEMFVDEKDFRS